MTYRIQGTLKLPDGAPAANCEIEFVSRKNFSPLVQGAKTNILTSAAGAYDVTLELGEYAVILYTGGTYPEQAGTITLSADTTPGLDLPSLLNRSDWVPATPEYMQQIEAWLVSSGQNAAAAEESADDAEASAQAAAASHALTAGAIAAHEAKAGAHSIAGVSGLQAALNDKEAAGAAASAVFAHKTESDAHAIEKITGLRGELDSLAGGSGSSAVVGREALRRSYSEAGFTLVDGSFEEGGTLTSASDVLLHKASGKAYSGPSGQVAAGTDPTLPGSVYISRSSTLLRNEVIPYLFEVGVSLKNKFGASDNSDITAELTAAINWSKLNGYVPVIIDVSGCSISSALPVLNDSFQFVPLYGRGSNISHIDITAAGDDVFTWAGGSGGLAGIVMNGLSLTGTSSQEPLLNKGLGGARFYDVDITAKTACKLSTDIGPGTFTEFVVFDSCRLHVKRIFTMQRGAGDGSFHGCGITNRTVVDEMAGNDGPMVVVGMPGDTQRCVWYNAPLDGQIFKNSIYPIIGNGRSGVNDVVMTVGNLTFENFTASPVLIGDLPAGVKHIHSGNILGWNLKYTLGSCVLASAASILPNGAIYGVAKPYVLEGVTSSTSINTGVKEGAGIGRLVNIRITGSNYDYQILVHFAGRISQYIVPVAKIVDTLVAFNDSGWGPPVVSVNDYELVISNPAWTGSISWTAIVGEGLI